MTPAVSTPRDEATDRGIRLYLRKSLSTLVITSLLVFLPAGDWSWTWGWILVGSFMLLQLAFFAILVPHSPDLVAERSRMHEGTKPWDKVLAPIVAILVPMATWMLAGFDYRFGWSPPTPLVWRVGAGIVMLAGYAFTFWAMYENRYFASTVRIQTDRGHQVIDRGPYAVMRHPGYVGAILHQLGTPILLGSWWTMLLSLIALALFIVRTALEDRMLRTELSGYAEYAARVRWRLLPGIW